MSAKTGRLKLLSGLACLLVPAMASAGGFEQGENGPRALGRGGAYAATVNEASALYFNPAALSRIRNTSFTANLNLMDSQVTFQREPYEYFAGAVQTESGRRTINFDEVEEQTGFYPAPMLFGAARFGLERWVFAAGVYGPASAGRAQYPDMEIRPPNYDGNVIGVYEPGRNMPITRDGGQAYQLVSQDVFLAYPSLAFSYEIPKANLSLGLTAQVATMFVEYDVGVDGIFGDGSANATARESDALYSSTRMSTKGVAPTGILGVMWEPVDRVALSLSYRPRFRVVSKGSIEVGYPEGLLSQNPQIDDDDATLRVWLPDVVRFGAAYIHPSGGDFSLFDVEVNAVYEAWSNVEGFDVSLAGALSDDAGAVQDQNLPDLFLGRYYRDTLSVRVGSDLAFLRNVETGNGPVFRLGGYYENASSPDAWTALDFTPFERFNGALGFSYHIGNFSIDAAYGYTASPSRTVTNGQYEALTPLWVCNDPPNENIAEQCAGVTESPSHAVNNGRYTSRYHTMSFGLTFNR